MDNYKRGAADEEIQHFISLNEENEREGEEEHDLTFVPVIECNPHSCLFSSSELFCSVPPNRCLFVCPAKDVGDGRDGAVEEQEHHPSTPGH